jgi:hypothetical protein
MKQSVLLALLGYTTAVKLSKHYPDVTFIQEDEDDEPKVIMTNLVQTGAAAR